MSKKLHQSYLRLLPHTLRSVLCYAIIKEHMLEFSSLTCLYSSESHLVSNCFLLVFLHHSTQMVILLPKRFGKGFLLNSPVYHHSHSVLIVSQLDCLGGSLLVLWPQSYAFECHLPTRFQISLSKWFICPYHGL